MKKLYNLVNRWLHHDSVLLLSNPHGAEGDIPMVDRIFVGEYIYNPPLTKNDKHLISGTHTPQQDM